MGLKFNGASVLKFFQMITGVLRGFCLFTLKEENFILFYAKTSGASGIRVLPHESLKFFVFLFWASVKSARSARWKVLGLRVHSP